MQYDANGIRVGKTRKIASNTTNSTYIYDNSGKLRTEIEGSTTRNYIYGADGAVGYEENGEHFMYRKNFFGDITAIYKGTTKIAEYSYDAWGNCTIVSDYNGYGARNPFRYRGYYFDTDLNMYYLTTRYYDPKTGRFINADAIEYLKPEAINGLNLYAYCANNPVMLVDFSGTDAMLLTVFDLPNGIPVVGHSILLIQVGDEWYTTQFVSDLPYPSLSLEFLKSLFNINTYIKTELLDMSTDEYLAQFDNYMVTEFQGDFTNSYEFANNQEYLDENYTGKYNLFTNNCAHYVQDILAKSNDLDMNIRNYFKHRPIIPVGMHATTEMIQVYNDAVKSISAWWDTLLKYF